MSCKHEFEWLSEEGYEGFHCIKCGLEYRQAVISDMVKNNQLDIRPIIAITMRACGKTYREIGETLGISKQAVEKMVKKYV